MMHEVNLELSASTRFLKKYARVSQCLWIDCSELTRIVNFSKFYRKEKSLKKGGKKLIKIE